jgi:hypothetical protein
MGATRIRTKRFRSLPLKKSRFGKMCQVLGNLFRRSLFVLFFPVLLPLTVLMSICVVTVFSSCWLWEWQRIRGYVKGDIARAWQRCSVVWQKAGVVSQEWHEWIPFPHRLAASLAQRHRSSPLFFRGKLLDPDPLLAAYAFKCLIRTCELRREEMPPGTLARAENVKVQHGRRMYEEPLGVFFEGYFGGHELALLSDEEIRKKIAKAIDGQRPAET